ncbi:MAG: flagellar hook-basal body complex protein FliE [Desulfosporosinus sp.]|jgi:flagellar hook-basal body complex protein FliE
MSIQPIVPITPLGALSPITATGLDSTPQIGPGDKVDTDFSKFLTDALKQVDTLQKNADLASLQLALGQVDDLSTVMVALEKASLSLSLTVTIRDKVLDAYNQIMRMQI